MAWPPRTILVGVDFSPASERALSLARAIAARTSGQLHLVHALDEFARRPTGFEPLDVLLGFEPEWERRRKRAADSLLDLAQRHELPKEQAHVVPGEPAEELAGLRDRLGADLLVLGGAHLRGLRHFVLGSRADRVLRRPGCPLLLVNEGPTTGVLKRIGVALETPDAPQPWLEHAALLAQSLCGELYVLHTLPAHPHEDHRSELDPEHVPDRIKRIVAAVDPTLPVEVASDTGDPAEVLAELSRRANIDLLVLGAVRQTDGWPGRVADRIARAGLPAVMLVWPPA